MWYIYTSHEGRHFPLEFGFKAIKSSEIHHDYDRLVAYCRDGCRSYNSGGCPPWAPRFEEVATRYPLGVLVFARFFTRYLPEVCKSSADAVEKYDFQDIILSNMLSKLGYALIQDLTGQVFFLSPGHCHGCKEQPCSFTQGERECRKPDRRSYSVSATGIDVQPTLRSIFNIELQWHSGGDYQVEYTLKVMGFLVRNHRLQNLILDRIIPSLQGLPCTVVQPASPGLAACLRDLNQA